MFTLIFPGQGSQQPQMGKWLFENFAEAKHTFEEASDALSFNVKKLCFDGSEKDLALTENTQVALLTVSTATVRVLKNKINPQISAAAGHSIGEYGALVAAGSLQFRDAVRAVRIRGQAMQAAVPVGKGGMLALLGVTDEDAKFLCTETVKQSGFGPLSPANYNCPGQIVISGASLATEWLVKNIKTLTDKKIKCIPLQVSAPFHCEMMRPAQDKMQEVLSATEFLGAQFWIVQNFDAKMHENAKELRSNLIEQVTAPVLWTQSMELLKEQGHMTFIECGVGKVLSGLLKKIDSENFKVFNINSLEDIETIGKLL